MGAKLSMPLHQVFKQELMGVNSLVNNILTHDNVFKNPDYNFLSQNVCAKHTIVLEEELGRHLKVKLQSLGTGLYLIPSNDIATTSQGQRISKREICAKISNHYMRILYILTLVKYVYDLEHHGDFSVAGIVFRNIKISNGIMAISHCSMPQKDYSQKERDNKIDFSTLEGLSFFVEYVMNKEESKVFIDVLKAILSRKPRGDVRKSICSLMTQKKLDPLLVAQVEQTFKDKYGTELQCTDVSSASSKKEISGTVKLPNLYMRVESNNPVFMKDYCYNVNEVIIELNDPKNKNVVTAFKKMQQNYRNNVNNIQKLTERLVVRKNSGVFELQDIGKPELDVIVEEVKATIKFFYIQSIIDFQHLLDIAKNNQNIEVNKER